MRKNKIGFTIIELLTTIFIIAILATAILVSLNISRENSINNTRLSNIQQIQLALENYYKDHGKYPDELNFGQALIGETNNKIYLSIIPKNQIWSGNNTCPNQEYIYEYNELNNQYSLYFCLSKSISSLDEGFYVAKQNGIFAHTEDPIEEPPAENFSINIVRDNFGPYWEEDNMYEMNTDVCGVAGANIINFIAEVNNPIGSHTCTWSTNPPDFPTLDICDSSESFYQCSWFRRDQLYTVTLTVEDEVQTLQDSVRLYFNYKKEDGCAFVYSYDGQNYHPEHAISDFAVHTLYEYPTYAILNKLRKTENYYQLAIWERIPENQYIDDIELWKIIHPKDTLVVSEQTSGKIHTISNKEYPQQANRSDGKSYLSQISEIDNTYYISDKDKENFYNAPMFDYLDLKFSKSPKNKQKTKLIIRAKDTGFLTFNWRNIVTLAEGPGKKDYDYLNPRLIKLLESKFGAKFIKNDKYDIFARLNKIGLFSFLCKTNIDYFCDINMLYKITNYIMNNGQLYIYQKIDGDYKLINSLMLGNVEFYHTWAIELEEQEGEDLEIRLMGIPYSHQIDEIYIDRSENQDIEIEKLKPTVIETNMDTPLNNINNSVNQRDYNYLKIKEGDYILINFYDNFENNENIGKNYIITPMLHANAYSEAYSFESNSNNIIKDKNHELLKAIIETKGLERKLYLDYFYKNYELKTCLPSAYKIGDIKSENICY